MNKRNIYTAAGIVLSFVIAIGGWVLTSRLIEINSSRLLSRTFNISTNTLDNMTVGMASTIPDSAGVRPNLSEDEIASILRNWDSAGRETPHEPTNEQLNMEQAIDAGREWLSFISGLNIFPDDLLHFNNTRAYLFQNLPDGQSGQFLPPEYSYWSVTFTSENMSINMVINAVTGQVWKTEANVFRFDIDISNHSIANTLAAFISTLNISRDRGESEIDAVITRINQDNYIKDIIAINDDVVIEFRVTGDFESIIAFQSFADNNAYAAVNATGWQLDDGIWILDKYRMYLTEEKPDQ